MSANYQITEKEVNERKNKQSEALKAAWLRTREQRTKTLTCKGCGSQFRGMSREFCSPCCKKAYTIKHTDMFARVPSICSIHTANKDYYG